jgi:Spy/CpxP family protein refolding chaperone
MKRTLTTFGLIAILLLLATTSISLAHGRGACGMGMHDSMSMHDGRGMHGGMGMHGDMDMHDNRDQLTAEQQQALESLQGDYAQEFKELEVALDKKKTAYRQARANGETTVAELNQLHDEMFELRDQYRSLRLAFNDEARKIAPEAVSGGSYYNHRDHARSCDGNGPRSGHAKRGWHDCQNDGHMRGGYDRGQGCW